MARSTPSYKGLRPASKSASRIHSRSSKKSGTRCELVLRAQLRRLGLTFKTNGKALPGNPDIVFPEARVAVFCDGDFWHGRKWRDRRMRLRTGTNSAYWVAKIESNMRRDRRRARELRSLGWTPVRLWETDILRSPAPAGRRVLAAIQGNTHVT